MKYRIVKETSELTQKAKYYIEKKHRFLFWSWWSKIKMLNNECSYDLDFDSYEKAHEFLDGLINKINKEVIETF